MWQCEYRGSRMHGLYGIPPISSDQRARRVRGQQKTQRGKEFDSEMVTSFAHKCSSAGILVEPKWLNFHFLQSYWGELVFGSFTQSCKQSKTNFKFKDKLVFTEGKVRTFIISVTKWWWWSTDQHLVFDVWYCHPYPKTKVRTQSDCFTPILKPPRSFVPNWVISFRSQCYHYFAPAFAVENGGARILVWSCLARIQVRQALDLWRSPARMDWRKMTNSLPLLLRQPPKRKLAMMKTFCGRKFRNRKNCYTSRLWDVGELYAETFSEGNRFSQSSRIDFVDTKYEFGKTQRHYLFNRWGDTPDSSRYFYANGYAERQQANEAQKQTLRKNLCDNGWLRMDFREKDGQQVPEMTDVLASISKRYQELYKQMTGSDLEKIDYANRWNA